MNKVAKPQQAAVKAVPAKKRKRTQSLNKKKERMGWLFVAPFAIGFILLYIPMVFESIKYSFEVTKNLPGGGIEQIFVGFQNYNYALLEDSSFTQTLITNLQQLVLDVPAIVIFSLFLAILLNQKMVGRAAFRAIFFIPVITATGIIESIELRNSLMNVIEQVGNLQSGTSEISTTSANDIISRVDVSRIFQGMQVGQELVGYVVSMVNNVYAIVNRSGVQMLIFLAGLQSISPSIYESCYIEGASAWETFWKITFPMISPMILVNAVYTIIDSFTRQSNTVMKYIDETMKGTYGANGYPHGTAMAWMYFLIVILIIALVAGLMSLYVFYQRKD
ncbi:MAG: hypothetical protein A2Y17_09285 [Clostridiales bacterium GWF2_38_85]|nr:MAG: hypothetical protein A2Y17_09285 [Clostridiales bacterium GWF2_38_85]HBL83609.1 sugar ABC transporter permease [Clostridiales bacterium]